MCLERKKFRLLTQTERLLMVQEKQMPLLAALVFLLDSLYLKPIPHSPDSLNILRLCCIKLDLLSYLFNMHCYSGNISNGFHIPDFGEKLFFCKYMVGILCQEGKQVKFLGCKGLFFPIYSHSSCSLVDLKTADLDDLI